MRVAPGVACTQTGPATPSTPVPTLMVLNKEKYVRKYVIKYPVIAFPEHPIMGPTNMSVNMEFGDYYITQEPPSPAQLKDTKR